MIDPHFHLASVALLKVYTPFLPPDVTDVASLQKALKEVAKQTPKGEWILGYFLVMDETRAPFASELDQVAPDNPVWIIHQAGHLGSANTLAMQLAGITKDTPNPPGGMIGRDKDGNPTGDFYTHRAMDALRKAAPQDLLKPDPQGILDYQSLLVANGITTFHDVYVRGLDLVKAFYTSGKSGKMTARGAMYPILENPDDVNAALKLERYQDEMFRLGGIKLQIDGQGPTAFTNQPHDGITWDKPYWEPDLFKQIVAQLHAAGFQIAIHCVGDAAVDLTLDAYEAAMNASPRSDPRHRIEHCILSTQEAHQRIKDLGIVVSESPTFLPMGGNYYLKHYGEQRVPLMMTTRDWLNKGIPLALNSDYPTTPWSMPQQNLAAAVLRMTATKQVVGGNQALTMLEALRAHTMGGAYAGFDESNKGSLEPGKLADLVIWSQDPLEADPLKMFLAKEPWIDTTFISGKQVYPAV
jgi:predicted amidohydrolase YtcJ